MTRRRALFVFVVAHLIGFLAPAEAQIVPPGADHQRPLKACTGGTGTAEVSGRIVPMTPDSTPSVVEILPATPLSRAYLQGLRFTLGGPPSGADLKQWRSSSTGDWTAYLAMHQSQLMAMMKIAQPLGDHFSCTGFSAGTYYVVALAQHATTLPKQMQKYQSAGGSNFDVYAAQAIVAARSERASVTPFYRLGTVGIPEQK